jgi:epoxyqueuosine reductase
VCGIAPAAAHRELAFLRDWLDRGYGGEMHYLHRTADRRADVRHVMPSAQSVICLGTVYNTDRPYSTEIADASRALLARYAWGDDYHDVIGKRMDVLLSWMRAASPEPFDARAYVDTGPVQERVYARHAGIGWIGKNTCVINPELGSWLFLAEIICSLPLDVDEPALDQCGDCTLCIEACPTQAIVGPGVLDSTRCISYLTIEQRGPIPDEFAPSIESRVYGCDVCQEVCPWNQTAPRSTDHAWQARSVWRDSSAAGLNAMSDAELGGAMKGSAMRRTKVAGLRRNLSVALASRS